VLTIGYVITEASSVWITTNRGVVVQGHPLAYDQERVLDWCCRWVGSTLRARTRFRDQGGRGDDVIVVGHGGRSHALKANIVAKREFAGYWSTCSTKRCLPRRRTRSGQARRSSRATDG